MGGWHSQAACRDVAQRAKPAPSSEALAKEDAWPWRKQEKRRMKTWMLIVVIVTAGFLPGCAGPTEQPWDTLEDCHKENTALKLRIDSLMAENTQLTEQVQTLSTLDRQTRLGTLATLESIRIGKRSGLYDNDDNGIKETLIVYLETVDTVQDHIKAVGECTVELWNLNTASQQALLKRWTIGPSDLHGVWGGNIFNAYFRLAFDISDLSVDNTGEMTMKAEFTDYLSGKVVRDQKVIQP